jgi:K+-transporting ATPase KdpF subunit
MPLTYLFGAVISASLLVYLLYAMLAPERLS